MGALVMALAAGQLVAAEKRGGILKLASPASPASMSVMEEATIVAQMPMMGVFNNLVLFDQHVPQVSLESIRPELATEWAWNEDGTELTFKLRQGVKWHDGKPFTAADVKCTTDLLMDAASEKLRVNPRKSSFDNIDRVTVNGDFEVTFHLKRPQPAFPMLLAGGFSTIYPCHVSPQTMRYSSDRHRPVQVCRIQAERGRPGNQQPRLLETRPALFGRRRIHDRPRPIDRDPGICFRAVRHDLPVRPDGAPDAGCGESGAAGDLSADPRTGQPASPDQPR